MSAVVRVEYRVGRRTLDNLESAVEAGTKDGQPVLRLQWGRRGLRHIEKRTSGGNWHRLGALPGVPMKGARS